MAIAKSDQKNGTIIFTGGTRTKVIFTEKFWQYSVCFLYADAPARFATVGIVSLSRVGHVDDLLSRLSFVENTACTTFENYSGSSKFLGECCRSRCLISRLTQDGLLSCWISIKTSTTGLWKTCWCSTNSVDTVCFCAEEYATGNLVEQMRC